MFAPIDAADTRLLAAADDVLRRNFDPPRHTVGAALLCESGRVFTGVNLDSSGWGPCAEPIALGAAISAGERDFTSVVAVKLVGDAATVLAPCGNCRQLLLDYAPHVHVLIEREAKLGKAPIAALLPDAYRRRVADRADVLPPTPAEGAERGDLLRHLCELELELQQPKVRRDEARLDELLHESFPELGRSGRTYSRAEMIEFLRDEAPTWTAWSQDFRLLPLADGVALLTYRSGRVDERGRLSRHSVRSSLWVMTPSGWQIRFHQGTPTDPFAKLEAPSG